MNTDLQTPMRHPPPFPIELAGPDKCPKGLRILVIEDDTLIGMLFADTLEGMGHTVCAIAVNEDEAIAAAREHSPDLMIVDAKLVHGSGISAVDEIVAWGFIPHVFVTGDKPSVVEIRPDAVVIEKPFRVAELAAAVRRAMTAARPLT
jgi:two-component system, response regulator PdtaR